MKIMNFRNKSPVKTNKDSKENKNSNTSKKKSRKIESYKIIGACALCAAVVMGSVGIASCSNPSPASVNAKASPAASAQASTLYDNSKDTALLDSSGKETDDKITVSSVKESDINKSDLTDWYFNHVAKDGYKYGILKFTDAPGKGVYADSTAIYEGDLKEDTATKGYTKPADTDLVYKVDSSKKTFTPANKEKSSAFPETPASAETAEAKEESKDTAASDSSKASSESGKSGNSGTSSSNVSKPAGGSSNSSGKSSSNSGKKACTPYTIHHDATGHYENTTTQQWVQDSAAWDETVVDSPAWDEQVDTGQGVYVCNNPGCGQAFNSLREWDDHIDSVHNGLGGYYIAPKYTTVHHDAVTHVVHHDATGHYEPVVTGQQWVQDSAAWDEQGCK